MHKKGFTLIELVMLIVIIGILALAVAPKAATNTSVRLEAACQKLASDLRYAQEMAMAQQVRFGISFNPGAESYFAYRVLVSEKAKDPQTRGDLDVQFNNMNEFKGIEISGTDFSNAIEFDASGSPYDGNDVLLSSEGIVTLQSGDGVYSKTVRIEPETGKVKIQ